MKRVVYADRREDILNRKKAFEENKAKREEESRQYYKAVDASLKPVKDYVENILSKYNLLDCTIDVDYSYKSYKPEVRIRCNESTLHSDKVALAWDFTIQIDEDGNVVKDSGSWSGLKATTEEQLEALDQTLSALKELNHANWKSVLNVDQPDPKDFHKTEWMKEENWDQQLKEVEVDDLVGTDTWIYLKSSPDHVPAYGNIIGETEKFYKVTFCPEYALKATDFNIDEVPEIRFYTQRVKKENLMDIIKFPIETL